MNSSSSSQSNTLGHWAYLAIEKHAQKTFKYETDVLKDQDPEDLHQMRVGMRRLRTVVTGFSAAIILPEIVSERNIGKIARTLGTLRDIDVLQEALVNRYFPHLTKKEQRLVKPALDALAKQRQKAFKQVQSILKSDFYLQVRQAFSQWLKKPDYREFAQMPIETVLPDLLLPHVSELFLHPAWLVGIESLETDSEMPHQLSPEAVESLIAERGELLHDLRKQAKRVRYQMNLFTDLYNNNFSNYVEDVKQIQTILGEIQDSWVLGEFLSETFDTDLKKETPKFAQLLAKTRYQSWQDWQSLQHRYLHSDTRQAFRQEILNPRLPESQNGNLPVSSSSSSE